MWCYRLVGNYWSWVHAGYRCDELATALIPAAWAFAIHGSSGRRLLLAPRLPYLVLRYRGSGLIRVTALRTAAVHGRHYVVVRDVLPRLHRCISVGGGCHGRRDFRINSRLCSPVHVVSNHPGSAARRPSQRHRMLGNLNTRSRERDRYRRVACIARHRRAPVHCARVARVKRNAEVRGLIRS